MRVVVLVGLLVELGLVLLLALLAYGLANVDAAEPTTEPIALLFGAGAIAIAALTVWAMFARRAESTRSAILGIVGAAHLVAAVLSYPTIGGVFTFVFAIVGAGCVALAFRSAPAAANR